MCLETRTLSKPEPVEEEVLDVLQRDDATIRAAAAFPSVLQGVLVPFAIYIAAASLLGDWVVDDAGISLAYARNLAHGHGFVAQPGVPPVEGFSNLLWVLALTPLGALPFASSAIAAKVLGGFAVLCAFYMLHGTMRSLTQRNAPGTALLSLLAVSPPIVVWTSSGLENGLSLFLVSALLDVLVRERPHAPVVAATLGALLAMTRPDGLVYGVATFAFVALQTFAGSGRRRGAVRRLSTFAVTFAALVGALFAFRRLVFGSFWPHTYVAKREHPSLAAHARALVDDPKAVFAALSDLAHGTAGVAGPALFVAIALALVLLDVRGRIDRRVWAPVVLFGAGAGAFVFLERDWMGEYRFATAPVAMAWTLAVLTLERLTREHRGVFVTTIGFVFCVAVADAGSRLLEFSDRAPTPYARVSDEASLLARFVEVLHVRGASVLTADVGAELVESPLRVYDLAGLCEPAVVKTLKRDSPLWLYDHPAFYTWVFEDAKPTFIVTRAFWTNVTSFTSDPRFTSAYAAIDSYEDRYVARVYGRYARSGLFVRRDALAGPHALSELRAARAPRTSSDGTAFPIAHLARVLGLRPPVLPLPASRDLRASAEHAERLDEVGATLEGRAAWQEIASRAHREGDLVVEARAIERLATADRTFEEDRLRQRRLSSAQLIDEGLRAYREGDHGAAIARWGLVAATDPLWATAQNNRASSFIVRHEFEEAERALDNARYANPSEQHFERNRRWLAHERATIAPPPAP